MAAKKKVTKRKRKKSGVIPIILVSVLFCAGVYSLFHFHFVFTNKGFTICRKTELTLTDTFADTRSWGPLDYVDHPKLTLALLRYKKAVTKDRLKELKNSFRKNKKTFGKKIEKELDKLFDN